MAPARCILTLVPCDTMRQQETSRDGACAMLGGSVTAEYTRESEFVVTATSTTSQDVSSAHDTASEGSPPDTLNERIGVLARREVEARIVAPLLEALGEEFGHERVSEIARDLIVEIAREQGAGLVDAMGGDSLPCFAESLQFWTRDNALEIGVLEQNDEAFSFNVTRCRYAELYRALGIPELGAVLSCNRDYALIEGFNPDVSLTRTQTIMEGASHCDFRYRLAAPEQQEKEDSK